ncbi:MAG: GH116 family glycosyl hydrolase [Candidatus Hodarchaeota archaeon]
MENMKTSRAPIEKIKAASKNIICGIPLGGIGTGFIELRADSRLWNWQIFNNRPWSGDQFLKVGNHSNVVQPWESLMAIQIREKGKPPVIRQLQKIKKDEGRDLYINPDIKNIKDISYLGEFPFINIFYDDDQEIFPVKVSLEAFSPFIPLDLKNSSLPCAIFKFKIKNLTSRPFFSSILFAIPNPIGFGLFKKKLKNEKIDLDNKIAIKFSGNGIPENHPTFNGNMTLISTSNKENVSFLSNRSYTSIKVTHSTFWKEFKEKGVLPNSDEPNRDEIDSDTFILENLVMVLDNFSKFRRFYKAIPVWYKTELEELLFPDIAKKFQEFEKIDLRFITDNNLRWKKLLELLIEKDNTAKQKFDDLVKLNPEILTDEKKKLKALEKCVNFPSDLLERLPLEYILKGNQGALSSSVKLHAFEEKAITFILTWYFPNHIPFGSSESMGHMYENWFKDSVEVASYIVNNIDTLHRRSLQFKEALYNSSFEYWLADSINSQLTTFITSSFFDKKGRFGIWEGLGCCGLQTLDVTYYGSFPVVLFFPELEKSQLSLTAKFQLSETSEHFFKYFMAFKENAEKFNESVKKDESILHNNEKRLIVIKRIMEETRKNPIGRIPHSFPGNFDHVDGYSMIELPMKFALLVYRNYIYLGEKEFLDKLWYHVKLAIDQVLRIHVINEDICLPYMFSRFETNTYIGAQTYDGWDFYGYSIYVSSIWIASLIATIKIAEIYNEKNYAEKLRNILIKATKSIENLLWNGKYYLLWKNPHAKPNDKREDYFIHADGLNGQWYANLLDFGHLFDDVRTTMMLKAINKYCRQPEQGLLNGFYPEKHYDKGETIDRNSQSDSPWTGTEYCVASLFIQEGMIKDGLEIVKEVYDRYLRVGMIWSHVECGDHYYRAMDVWCVLMALEGYYYNSIKKLLRFQPKITKSDFRSVYVNSKSWGVVEQKGRKNAQIVTIIVYAGILELKEVELELIHDEKRYNYVVVKLNDSKIKYEDKQKAKLISIIFENVISINPNDKLSIYFDY